MEKSNKNKKGAKSKGSSQVNSKAKNFEELAKVQATEDMGELIELSKSSDALVRLKAA
jgi:hypothetical protein